MFEVGVCGCRQRGSQVGVDVSQDLWQQGGNVCVHGSEPGVSSGGVFTAQHHRVLAVWWVKLQESKSEEDSNHRTRRSQNKQLWPWKLNDQWASSAQQNRTQRGLCHAVQHFDVKLKKKEKKKNDFTQLVTRAQRRGAAYLFSRSGMVRFLLIKHIFRLMTFLSLEEAGPLCLGEPESSLPL